MITAKIKFGFLLCCLLMRFLIFSLVFWMLRIVFNVFSMMFAKMSLLFCCFCIRLFGTNNVCVVPYGVMRNLDAIIRVSNYVRLNPGLHRARSLWSCCKRPPASFFIEIRARNFFFKLTWPNSSRFSLVVFFKLAGILN